MSLGIMNPIALVRSLRPRLWISGHAQRVADGTSLASVSDSSGHGISIAQGAGAKQPALSRSAANRGGAIVFDGTDDDMLFTIDLSNTATVTMLATFRDDLGSGRLLLDTGSAWFNVSGSLGLTTSNNAANDVQYSGRSTANPQANYQVTHETAAGIKVAVGVVDFTQVPPAREIVIYLNGASTTTTDSFNGDNTGTFSNRTYCLGARNESTFFFNGALMTLTIFDSGLSAAAIAALWRCTQAEWSP